MKFYIYTILLHLWIVLIVHLDSSCMFLPSYTCTILKLFVEMYEKREDVCFAKIFVK